MYFKPEAFEKLDTDFLKECVTKIINIPYYICENIVDDYCTGKEEKLIRNNYEYIMSEFYNVNEKVIQSRLEIFNYFDVDQNGYIDSNELFSLNKYLDCHLVYTNNNRVTYPVHKVFKKYNKNIMKKLNFLEVFKYMKELNVNFI